MCVEAICMRKSGKCFLAEWISVRNADNTCPAEWNSVRKSWKYFPVEWIHVNAGAPRWVFLDTPWCSVAFRCVRRVIVHKKSGELFLAEWSSTSNLYHTCAAEWIPIRKYSKYCPVEEKSHQLWSPSLSIP